MSQLTLEAVNAIVKIDSLAVLEFAKRKDGHFKAKYMYSLCVESFIPLLNLGQGNILNQNTFYRQYIIGMLDELREYEYLAQLVILGR